MYIAKNIRYLRRLNNMSQDALAERLEYKSFTTIQKWEAGTSEPPIGIVNELANIFHVNIDDLVKKDLETPAADPEPSLSDRQKELLRIYDELNDIGKDDLLKQARMMEISGMYQNDEVDTSGGGDMGSGIA